MNNKTNSSLEDIGIYYTIAVLQFQIAELHKMKGKQLNDEGRSLELILKQETDGIILIPTLF
jgi:hypothetical protein